MNNKELHAARTLLMLTTNEAAIHVAGLGGKKPARGWQRWESGERAVPDYVPEKMRQLLDKRLLMIEETESLIDEITEKEGAPDRIEISYYRTIEEYQADHRESTLLDWRLSQSVAAYFYCEFMADLV